VEVELLPTDPKLVNEALPSELVEAAIVHTSEAEAGELLLAFSASFPAATERKIPDLTTLAAASFIALENSPPRDIFITDFPVTPRDFASLTAQSIPEMTPELVPEPSAPRTLTATREAFFATPYLLPAAVDAVWVPWPLPSVLSLSTVLVPHLARPPNVGM
jgi:hypothetical protein